MNLKQILVAVGTIVVSVVVSVIVVGGNNQPQELGGGTRFPHGISADSTSPNTGQVRGTTFNSTGLATLNSATITTTLTQSTSNTATTSARLGCIQTTATSTATPIRFVLQATTTVGNAVQGGSSTNNFVVLAQFGSCPI